MKEFVIAKSPNIFSCEMDLKNFGPEILPIFKNLKFSDPNFKKNIYPRKHIEHSYYAIFLGSSAFGAYFKRPFYWWRSFFDVDARKEIRGFRIAKIEILESQFSRPTKTCTEKTRRSSLRNGLMMSIEIVATNSRPGIFLCQ